MKKHGWSWMAVGAIVLVSCANITINVYFPAESVQQAADVIEDKVRGEVLETAPSEEAPAPQAKASGGWLDRLCPPAYAQEVDLNINTPEIQKITEARKERFPKIDALLTKGVVGEGNDGLLKDRDLRSLPLKEVAEARKLINAENADRQKLYQAIAAANDIAEDKVADIGKNFAKKIPEKLRPGQYYQNEEGAWVEKKPEKQ